MSDSDINEDIINKGSIPPKSPGMHPCGWIPPKIPKVLSADTDEKSGSNSKSSDVKKG